MTFRPDDWPRVKALFDAALEVDDAARAAFVAASCGDDAELRRQVETLLAEHLRAGGFLDTPAHAVLSSPPDAEWIGRTIGTYRVTAKLGAGGMGEVYAAHDTNLDRPVALKLLPAAVATDTDRLRRFRAEARAASSLNHPHILVIHDFGDVAGRPFMVTELVEGATLRQRMAGGPVPVREAVDIAVQVASALTAAHGRGLVHRDIKPENVMLRPDGYVKVLDFGLAKLWAPTAAADGEPTIVRTTPGLVLGTPRYMSPEQARGLDVDARSDVWSVGVMLYEMLAGRAPFTGATPADVMAAVLGREPEPLDRDVTVPRALGEIVTKALAKDAGGRFASAQELHQALTALRTALDSGVDAAAMPAVAPPGRTRLMVLPFRMLKGDTEIDFLAFSLPDALTATLSGLDSIVVRSSLVAARFAGEAPDLLRIARDAQVDLVVSGTLLRAGDQLRVAAQLSDAAAGTLIWSHTAQAAIGDLFGLQDALVARIAGSLALPLTDREQQRLRQDVPASGKAYELFLRANQLTQGAFTQAANLWTVARDLYLQSVAQDPLYAPAWARLARVYRLLGKYRTADADANLARAEDALQRALALNPDLSIAHNLYAQMEVDRGRAEHAMVRLLERLQRRGPQAEIFAGLVQACRFCGLLDASLAAHAHAHRLDPALSTSVMHTYFVMRRYQDVIAVADDLKGYVFSLSLAALGRGGEAIAIMARLEKDGHRTPDLVVAARALIEGNRSDGVEALTASARTLADPEVFYYAARHFAHLDQRSLALDALAKAIGGGYFCYEPLTDDPWFDPIRHAHEFQELLDRCLKGRQSAIAAFRDAGGPELLTARPAIRTSSDRSR